MDAISRREALKAMAAASGAVAFASVTTGNAASAAGVRAGHRARLTGTLVYPGDQNYDAARQLWDRLFSSSPRVVAFCDRPSDAVNAIAWARQNGVEIRARSGRHNLAGWSGTDGGITIDVSKLRDIVIDRRSGTAKVGTGNTQSQMITALGQADRVVPTGSEASVGIGGVTLGGGIGFLTRSMGVTCDSLVGLEIAVPSGKDGARLLTVDERHHPDLLWACRGGGGGNFGVATSYTFRTHHLTTASLCEVIWPYADWQAAFTVWQEWCHTTDIKFGTNFAVLGKQADYVALQGVFTGPEDTMKSLLAPLLAVGTPKVITKSGSYVQVYDYFNQSGRNTDNWLFSSSWANEQFPAEAVQVVDAYMSKAPAPLCNFWCLAFGGATTEVPSGGSAWFHRNALFYAEPGAGWNGSALTDACESWLADFHAALSPYVKGGYVNVPNATAADWGTEYYGTNFPRLRRVKAAYDPQNVFNFPQSIPLA
jgi:hypothetical protein